MKATRLLISIVVLGVILGGEPVRAQTQLKLSFGVYTSDKPTDMYRQFKPGVVYLEEYLSSRLAKPVRITLHIYRSYDSARDDLVAGGVDFVRFGPASYILAKEQARTQGGDVSLLAMEQENGGTSFNGVIFTRQDSGINTLRDLRGKSFAFGDPSSTIGRFLSQALLIDQGIYAKDLARFEYLERHDQVVSAVLSRKFDAGVAKEDTFAKFKDQGLKALVAFSNVTKPWVARGSLDPQVADAIKQGLLELKEKKVLEALGGKISGFAVSSDDMYDVVRVGMEKSKRFAPEAKTASASTAN